MLEDEVEEGTLVGEAGLDETGVEVKDELGVMTVDKEVRAVDVISELVGGRTTPLLVGVTTAGVTKTSDVTRKTVVGVACA